MLLPAWKHIKKKERKEVAELEKLALGTCSAPTEIKETTSDGAGLKAATLSHK